jgi:hypothetical protein
MSPKLDLRLVPHNRREQVLAIYREDPTAGLGAAVLAAIPNQEVLFFVAANADAMLDAGVFEPALAIAYVCRNQRMRQVSVAFLKRLFDRADRSRLQACGVPVPPGYTRLYRGVSGRGRHRNERGFSWSPNVALAAWHARNPPGRHDPALLTTVAAQRDIYFCPTPPECIYFATDYERIEPIPVFDGDPRVKIKFLAVGLEAIKEITDGPT